jgi:glycosyltransferase involved in cell wall biosynthesis
MSRVLVVSSDGIAERMAGPAIRCLELSRALSGAGHDVTLAAPEVRSGRDEPFTVASLDRRELRALAGAHDAILIQGWTLERHPVLARSGVPLVVDLYDPFALELLMLLEGRTVTERAQAQAHAMRAMCDQLDAGDFFLCASERQRDYWLGWLDARGRINPRTHDEDPELRTLIDVAPFGLPSAPPERRGPGCRGVMPGVGEHELVLLWAGGVYNWLDPVTLVRAVAASARQHPELRLVFMSATYPDAAMPELRRLGEARTAAGELGVDRRQVLFNEEWVPYERRADWLLDADVGVSAHLEQVESRFSFRTRILDYLWTGLPVLCTRGDTLADEIETRGIGNAVAPGDVDAAAAAISRLAADAGVRAECGRRAREYASSLTWDRAAAPLVAFCAQPRRAADLDAGAALRPTRDRPLSRRWLAARARRLASASPGAGRRVGW